MLGLFFTAKARADDPFKSFADIEFAVSEEKSVKNFKAALPYLEDQYFREQGIPFGQWHNLLKDHPFAVYFAYLLANKSGEMSGRYVRVNTLCLLNNNRDQIMSPYEVLSLTLGGKLYPDNNMKTNALIAEELYAQF